MIRPISSSNTCVMLLSAAVRLRPSDAWLCRVGWVEACLLQFLGGFFICYCCSYAKVTCCFESYCCVGGSSLLLPESCCFGKLSSLICMPKFGVVRSSCTCSSWAWFIAGVCLWWALRLLFGCCAWVACVCFSVVAVHKVIWLVCLA